MILNSVHHVFLLMNVYLVIVWAYPTTPQQGSSRVHLQPRKQPFRKEEVMAVGWSNPVPRPNSPSSRGVPLHSIVENDEGKELLQFLI